MIFIKIYDHVVSSQKKFLYNTEELRKLDKLKGRKEGYVQAVIKYR